MRRTDVFLNPMLKSQKTILTIHKFAASVNEFLAFRRYKILKDKGSVSAEISKSKAYDDYASFNKTQNIISDFDKEVRKLLENGDLS